MTDPMSHQRTPHPAAHLLWTAPLCGVLLCIAAMVFLRAGGGPYEGSRLVLVGEMDTDALFAVAWIVGALCLVMLGIGGIAGRSMGLLPQRGTRPAAVASLLYGALCLIIGLIMYFAAAYHAPQYDFLELDRAPERQVIVESRFTYGDSVQYVVWTGGPSIYQRVADVSVPVAKCRAAHPDPPCYDVEHEPGEDALLTPTGRITLP
ncbi:hypothetical protein [Isoptericola aurantiacus]|uniref:hypothetical protein n=1 Tax=Isoptericola aurantiacus TaxID=3377839 RepID=UPI00383AB3C7